MFFLNRFSPLPLYNGFPFLVHFLKVQLSYYGNNLQLLAIKTKLKITKLLKTMSKNIL